QAVGDDRPALMNFKADAAGRALARRVPIGHRALVYVTDVQLFIWAIEFTGTVEGGEAARLRHGFAAGAHKPFSIYRPIRFLARAEPYERRGGRLRQVCERSGVPLAFSQGDSLVFISRDEYDRLYRSIDWTSETP
ncbi:MAG: hypothetical protein ACAI43_09320, partial [Phycisphaerae bacterium]